MRFRFVEEHIASFPTKRLCQVVGVSTRGLRALRSRPASHRQRSDLITLAHIREQSHLSLGSYGRPRMTEELEEIGLNIGHRRVGRLMRQNGISVARTRKHKVTTDSDHKFNIAPNYWTVTLPRTDQTRNGPVTSVMSGHARAGCILPSFWICIPGVSSAGPSATG